MKLLSFLAAVVLVAATNVACGARTQLATFDQRAVVSVGSAGDGGGGNGGGGGSGGAGGFERCNGFAELLPVRGVGAGDGINQLEPILSYSSDDGQSVTMVLGWQVDGGPNPRELRHVTTQPWDSWPETDLAPIFLADFDRGVSYAAAASPGNRFALLMSDGTNSNPPAGVVFTPDMRPGEGTIGAVTTLDQAGENVLFATEAERWHLLGFDHSGPNSQSFVTAALEVDDGLQTVGPIAVGCASSNLAADAIAQGDGWLLAASSAITHIPDPCLIDGPAGLDQRIGLARVDTNGSVTEIGHVFAGDDVRRVVLAATSDGAWLVYDTNAAGWPIEAARIDAAGAVVAGPFLVENIVELGFSATALGDRLLVAYMTSSSLELRLFDEQGQGLAEASVDGGWGPPSLLASPAGDGALVAWMEGDMARRARIMRVDCLF